MKWVKFFSFFCFQSFLLELGADTEHREGQDAMRYVHYRINALPKWIQIGLGLRTEALRLLIGGINNVLK